MAEIDGLPVQVSGEEPNWTVFAREHALDGVPIRAIRVQPDFDCGNCSELAIDRWEDFVSYQTPIGSEDRTPDPTDPDQLAPFATRLCHLRTRRIRYRTCHPPAGTIIPCPFFALKVMETHYLAVRDSSAHCDISMFAPCHRTGAEPDLAVLSGEAFRLPLKVGFTANFERMALIGVTWAQVEDNYIFGTAPATTTTTRHSITLTAANRHGTGRASGGIYVRQRPS